VREGSESNTISWCQRVRICAARRQSCEQYNPGSEEMASGLAIRGAGAPGVAKESPVDARTAIAIAPKRTPQKAGGLGGIDWSVVDWSVVAKPLLAVLRRTGLIDIGRITQAYGNLRSGRTPMRWKSERVAVSFAVDDKSLNEIEAGCERIAGCSNWSDPSTGECLSQSQDIVRAYTTLTSALRSLSPPSAGSNARWGATVGVECALRGPLLLRLLLVAIEDVVAEAWEVPQTPQIPQIPQIDGRRAEANSATVQSEHDASEKEAAVRAKSEDLFRRAVLGGLVGKGLSYSPDAAAKAARNISVSFASELEGKRHGGSKVTFDMDRFLASLRREGGITLRRLWPAIVARGHQQYFFPSDPMSTRGRSTEAAMAWLHAGARWSAAGGRLLFTGLYDTIWTAVLDYPGWVFSMGMYGYAYQFSNAGILMSLRAPEGTSVVGRITQILSETAVPTMLVNMSAFGSGPLIPLILTVIATNSVVKCVVQLMMVALGAVRSMFGNLAAHASRHRAIGRLVTPLIQLQSWCERWVERKRNEHPAIPLPYVLQNYVFSGAKDTIALVGNSMFSRSEVTAEQEARWLAIRLEQRLLQLQTEKPQSPAGVAAAEALREFESYKNDKVGQNLVSLAALEVRVANKLGEPLAKELNVSQLGQAQGESALAAVKKRIGELTQAISGTRPEGTLKLYYLSDVDGDVSKEKRETFLLDYAKAIGAVSASSIRDLDDPRFFLRLSEAELALGKRMEHGLSFFYAARPPPVPQIEGLAPGPRASYSAAPSYRESVQAAALFAEGPIFLANQVTEVRAGALARAGNLPGHAWTLVATSAAAAVEATVSPPQECTHRLQAIAEAVRGLVAASSSESSQSSEQGKEADTDTDTSGSATLQAPIPDTPSAGASAADAAAAADEPTLVRGSRSSAVGFLAGAAAGSARNQLRQLSQGLLASHRTVLLVVFQKVVRVLLLGSWPFCVEILTVCVFHAVTSLPEIDTLAPVWARAVGDLHTKAQRARDRMVVDQGLLAGDPSAAWKKFITRSAQVLQTELSILDRTSRHRRGNIEGAYAHVLTSFITAADEAILFKARRQTVLSAENVRLTADAATLARGLTQTTLLEEEEQAALSIALAAGDHRRREKEFFKAHRDKQLKLHLERARQSASLRAVQSRIQALFIEQVKSARSAMEKMAEVEKP
jgi:hypothetical protein